MSLTIHNNNLSADLLIRLLGYSTRTPFESAFVPTQAISFGDSFQPSPSDAILQNAVRKMQEAVNQPVRLANGQFFGGGMQQGAVQFRISPQRITLSATSATIKGFEPSGPTEEQVARGIEEAGGREALAPWLVNGKTKISVDGQGGIAEIGPARPANTAVAPRAAAEESLARFGISGDRLDGDFDSLRSDLLKAADAASGEDRRLAYAVEYALEDAFAKLRALEDSRDGASAATYNDQLAVNRKQAKSIVSQLGLGISSSWAMDSAASDLATFGKDMTALADREGLADDLKRIHGEKTADAKNRYAGSEMDYRSRIRALDGALSRLMGGLTSSNPTAAASMTATGSVKVTVAGVQMNASSVVSMVNVIADPLVLDLAGDGIDLRSAEDGVDFDMNGDGAKARTGFIQGDDALLFYNESDSDTVADGRQLFGNADGYANGFEKLRAFDGNGDGIIDEQDPAYDKLRLWQDKDGDGACGDGEAMTLAAAGVKAIRTGYDNVREDDGKGNLIGQKGSFIRNDGSEGLTADVWLRELAENPRHV